MDPLLVNELKRCSQANWFGYSEGLWQAEEKVSGMNKHYKPDRQMMDELSRLGYIESTNKNTLGPLGIMVNDWRVTDSGKKALEDALDSQTKSIQ